MITYVHETNVDLHSLDDSRSLGKVLMMLTMDLEFGFGREKCEGVCQCVY